MKALPQKQTLIARWAEHSPIPKDVGSTCFIVGCSAKKQKVHCSAREMYQSVLFKKAIKWAEHFLGEWDHIRILSAHYGLIRPEKQIAPYNLNLKYFSKDAFAAWEMGVREELAELLYGNLHVNRIVWLCGQDYIPSLTFLKGEGIFHDFPMKSMGIGTRLSFLSAPFKGPEVTMEEDGQLAWNWEEAA